MIKRLRLQFFFVSASIVFVMLGILCGTILLTTHFRNVSNANESLDQVTQAFQRFLETAEGNENNEQRRVVMHNRRAFVVMVDEEYNQVPPVHISSYFSDEEIREFTDQILRTGSASGFQSRVIPIEGGWIVSAIDMSLENDAFRSLALTVSLIGFGGLIVLTLFVWFLSKWMVRPAVESMNKQTRFVSEASHELKTPLTIISAGVELLKKEKLNPKATKWLDDIKLQTDKMTIMTTDLLTLSKLSEPIVVSKDEINLGMEVQNATLAFESVAYEQGKVLICDIKSDTSIKAARSAVIQVVNILCDNAIKHSKPKSKIEVQLEQNVLTVSNLSDSLAESEVPFLFERFYRGSVTRANTQGTGLGLAILKSLSDQNGWKVDVSVNEKEVTFTVKF